MHIDYLINKPLSTDEFIDILERSSLGERRPIEDRECVSKMVENGTLWVTAWDGAKLVGVARSITDFSYACYLSELAVDRAYQGMGIGKTLVSRTKEQLGAHCRIRLISAPAAEDYYPKIGFVKNEKCWELR